LALPDKLTLVNNGKLVRNFSKFPGIGKRSAERMVFHLLKMKQEEVRSLAHHIEEIHNHIKPCKLCNNFSTKDICSICDDPRRDKDVVCVVEEPKDIMAIGAGPITLKSCMILSGS